MGAKPATVNVAIAVDAGDWPDQQDLVRLTQRAVDAAYDIAVGDGVTPCDDYQVSVVFTDDTAMQALNRQWRGKDSPTNVLSFPQSGSQSGSQSGQYSGQESGQLPWLLGDIVLGSETVRREAALENKLLNHHIAHLVVHGFLHLVGYDHEDSKDAERMEQLERNGLAIIDIADPYAAIATIDG